MAPDTRRAREAHRVRTQNPQPLLKITTQLVMVGLKKLHNDPYGCKIIVTNPKLLSEARPVPQKASPAAQRGDNDGLSTFQL